MKMEEGDPMSKPIIEKDGQQINIEQLNIEQLMEENRRLKEELENLKKKKARRKQRELRIPEGLQNVVRNKKLHEIRQKIKESNPKRVLISKKSLENKTEKLTKKQKGFMDFESLSEEKQQEVLDFISFLKSKSK